MNRRMRSWLPMTEQHQASNIQVTPAHADGESQVQIPKPAMMLNGERTNRKRAHEQAGTCRGVHGDPTTPSSRAWGTALHGPEAPTGGGSSAAHNKQRRGTFS